MKLLFKLLGHQWKEKLRSPFWQKRIWINIILGLLLVYLIVILVSIGFMADKIIGEIYKDKDIVRAFTGLLFYYFALDLIFRFLFQPVPVASITPYLTLPVKKGTLLHLPLIKTLPGFFNLIALLLLLPFYFKVIYQVETPGIAVAWLITLLSLITINNFLGFLLKKYMVKQPLIIIGLLLLLIGVFYFDLKGQLSVSEYFVSVFSFVTGSPLLSVLPVLIAILSYGLAYRLLRRHSYLEEERKTVRRISSGFSFLSKYGEAGSLMQNELKMILRNKRPKSMIYLTILFMFYGFIFYNPDMIENGINFLFAGVFLTSISSLFHGQFIFQWESSFFDTYMANKVTAVNYMKSKYWLFAVLNMFTYLVSLLYGFLYPKIVLINTSLFIFNTGISSIILLIFGTYYRSRMNLDKSPFMNYQGTGILQYVLMLPLFGIPVLTYLLFKIFGNPDYCYYVLALFGIFGIIFNEYLLGLTARLFLRNKYKMAAGFRIK